MFENSKTNKEGLQSFEIDESFFFDGKKNISTEQMWLSTTNTFTYEFWVKPEAEIQLVKQAAKGVSGLQGQRFVIFPAHGGEHFAGTGISVGTNGIIVFEHGAEHFPATLVHKVSIIKWTHIAVVYKEKTPYLYINGKFIKRGISSYKEALYPSGVIGGLETYGYYIGFLKNLRICQGSSLNDLEKKKKTIFEWNGFNETKQVNHDKTKLDKKIKLIAFYLPQFHEIPENNKWWGHGFTEWTNTRKAKPLFKDHYQPRVPYEQNYYDITEASVRNWQAKLAESFGIYGFCYYHYWFKGKMLLEKPLQNILASSEPKFPFCLSWANEPWTRKWDGSEKEILMPQEYGDEKDWQEHFEYLLQAFSDDRYIKVDGKPMFLIYRPQIIPECGRMLVFWDNLAKQNGFEGMYFIETLNGFPKSDSIESFHAAVEFEPHYTMIHGKANNAWRKREIPENKTKLVLDYDAVWSSTLNRIPTRPNTIPGAFVDWDNTARLGINSTIYSGATPEKWQEYLTMQLNRAREDYYSEFLFINAWNEWAEGAYLEPDSKYGFAYLEGVKNALINTNNLTTDN